MSKQIPPMKPPYYAVIFTSIMRPGEAGYQEMSDRMVKLVSAQPGFLGFDSARAAETGLGITVSYWRDRESIRRWREAAEHREAQSAGRERWYSQYSVRVAEVLEDRGFGA